MLTNKFTHTHREEDTHTHTHTHNVYESLLQHVHQQRHEGRGADSHRHMDHHDMTRAWNSNFGRTHQRKCIGMIKNTHNHVHHVQLHTQGCTHASIHTHTGDGQTLLKKTHRNTHNKTRVHGNTQTNTHKNVSRCRDSATTRSEPGVEATHRIRSPYFLLMSSLFVASSMLCCRCCAACRRIIISNSC